MLQRLQRAPIRQKLMLIAMATTGGALPMAGCWNALADVHQNPHIKAGGEVLRR